MAPDPGPEFAVAAAETPQPSEQSAEVRFPTDESSQKWGIELVSAQTWPMEQNITANAVLSYDQTCVAQLSTRVPGTVWRVEKHVGEHVSQGDVLAIVEALDVGRAKADFLEAVARENYHAKTVERLTQLQANVVSGRQVLEAQSELRRSRVQLFNAQQALVNLGLPIQLAEIAGLDENALVAKVRFLGLPDPIVESLDPERTTANLIPLFAPFSGIVIGREVVRGEVVTPGESQFVVADVSRMWIHLHLRQEDAVRVGLGQEVRFTADGIPRELQAVVTWVSTEVDERTRTVEVRAEWHSDSTSADQRQNVLAERANTFGTGKVTVRSEPNATVVPNQAIQWDGERHMVFIKSAPGTFEQRIVELGTVGDRFTEILSGVEPGEVMASLGSHLLKSQVVRQRLARSLASATSG